MRAVLTRTASGARRFIASATASASCSPMSAANISMSHGGYESRAASRSRPVRRPSPASSAAARSMSTGARRIRCASAASAAGGTPVRAS